MFIIPTDDAILFKECLVFKIFERTEHYYRLFAGMVINGAPGNDRFIDLQKWMNEIDPETSEEMLEELKDRSFMFRPNAFREADNKYIFLVTCDYSHDNDRLVLVGERIRG